ncbi:hypothetical protein [Nonomuraea gerenzanensis]|uniref:MarR-family transcriptional regulator n=1 Tax=Nonomuraea gerenzanensis TaxID=93944 RepID=A0A1M4EED1_9ACTN|nr:hypothetical protein [Nonomuraea gerenzanensis]UBU08805.1 hypothetical protein LCN96_30965 [Nonomuraea gerenzanensis]SBO97170.1 MarR-family transcriptional regulator [Nonomuraea gerenzanensis]
MRTEPHPGDGRKLLLHITGDWRARLQRERDRRAGTLDAAIRDVFTPEERQQLRACVPLLSRLTAHLTGD